MLFFWYRIMLKIVALFGIVLLSACQNTHSTRQIGFKLDDGVTQQFDFTKRGALPADNGTYKVEGLGLMLYQKPKTKEVYYAWDVTVNLAAKPAKSVVVSQVLSGGGVQQMVVDREPMVKNDGQWRQLPLGAKSSMQAQRWHAVSAGHNINQAKWLAQSDQDAMFVFKVEIVDVTQHTHVLYQPMVVSQDSKKQYLKVLQDALNK